MTLGPVARRNQNRLDKILPLIGQHGLHCAGIGAPGFHSFSA
jgi:hypothetical protein